MKCVECCGTEKGKHRRFDPAPICKMCGGSGRVEHNTFSPDCCCEPEIEELDNGDLLVIHRDKSEEN